MRKTSADYVPLTQEKHGDPYRPTRQQPASPSSASGKGVERLTRRMVQRRRVFAVFALGMVLGAAIWLTLNPHLALRPRYDCPSPLTPRSARATPLRRPSAPLVLPAALPEFSVSITYDTAVCNSFDVVISRLDEWRCAEVEADAAPTNHSAFLDFARTRLGPDTFHIQIYGAERLAEEVPTEYLGSCEYLHRFRLNNAGRVWMNASLLYEDYEAVKERDVEPGTWPKDLPLLLRPLTPAPVELDLCSPACHAYVPPHLGDKSLSILSAVRSAIGHRRLPSCSEAARRGTLRSGYFPVGMFDLLYPEHRQPVGWDSTRLSAGHTRWTPFVCEWRSDGRRVANPASCIAKEHRLLLIGDSHARAMFDLVSHRLSGNKTIVQKSVKSAHKNATRGNVHLDFTFNPFLNKTFTCERFGGYDTIAVSTGTWQTALNCATYDTLRKELEHLFSAWPRLAYECRRPITPRNLAILDSSTARATRFIWLNLPAFHPQLHRHDCRTGPRLHFWNERFGRLARRHGWEVVDVESLTKPIAIDMTLGDGVHYIGTDAAEPAADDFIDRLGLCGETSARD